MSKKEPLIQRVSSKRDDIATSEQQRIIEDTGLMKKLKKREAELAAERVPSTSEYIWQSIFLSIPFGFLLAAFDMTVKVQYSEPWSYPGIGNKALRSATALVPFIYLTNTYKARKLTQFIMMLGSIVAGTFLFYTVQHSPTLGQMSRAPGLATLWIYFIVQLDLIPALGTLAVAGAYWYHERNS